MACPPPVVPYRAPLCVGDHTHSPPSHLLLRAAAFLAHSQPLPIPIPAASLRGGPVQLRESHAAARAAPAAKHLYELALQLNPQHAKAGKNLEIATASIKDEGRE